MTRRIISLLLIALLAAACTPAQPTNTVAPQPTAEPPPQATATALPPPATLTVFAAVSLTEAFHEIKADFEAAHPGVTVVYNFAASNALAQQLGQGAPADVFASADNAQMNVAIEAGRVISGTTRTLVRNRLAVIVPTGNPGGVETLQDLAKPGLKIVLAAAAVPVGQYALDFLDKAVRDAAFGATFKDAVLANVASYEENVRAVLTKIVLGEGDAGIVYTSDISHDAASQVERLDIPDALNTIASYPIGTIQDSANPELAQTFMDYTLAPEGQRLLAAYGFMPTTGDPTGAAPGAVPVEIVGLAENSAVLSSLKSSKPGVTLIG